MALHGVGGGTGGTGGTNVAAVPSTTTVSGLATAKLVIVDGGITKQITMADWIALAGTSLTSLPSASSVDGTEIVQINQGGVDKQATVSLIRGTGGTSTVSGVTVSPSTATGSTTFTAVVAGTNSPSQAVTWTCSPVGTIDVSTGAFTAPAATASIQTITITATSTQDNTKTGTATVTIAASGGGGTAYTIVGYGSPANTVKPSLDISNTTTFPTYSGYRYITPDKTGSSSTYQIYWNINATSGGAQPASAKAGWSTSSTVPPDDANNTYLTGNTSSAVLPNGAVNVYVTMAKATAFDIGNLALWVPAGAGSVTRYLWIKPVDGPAQMVGSISITGA